ncbi:DUF4158 domain-containing protein [Streptomyces sp. NPDC060333]|uniref:DUF4158 domain-containing protein n=1 Tax=Streptomyces sp. NPDC060333 TaxID=3347098 RepID=UPI003652BAF8
MREFVAARVRASLEGPRALFDRTVVWLVDNRVLLPGITTLTRLVAEVRAAENAALYRTLDAAVPDDLRQSMRDLLKAVAEELHLYGVICPVASRLPALRR